MIPSKAARQRSRMVLLLKHIFLNNFISYVPTMCQSFHKSLQQYFYYRLSHIINNQSLIRHNMLTAYTCWADESTILTDLWSLEEIYTKYQEYINLLHTKLCDPFFSGWSTSCCKSTRHHGPLSLIKNSNWIFPYSSIIIIIIIYYTTLNSISMNANSNPLQQ